MVKSRFRLWLFTVFLLTAFVLAACEGVAIPNLPSDFDTNIEIDLSTSTVEFFGSVEKIDTDSWIIAGITVGITSQTEIEGKILVGDRVKVEARIQEDGSLIALEIKLADEELEDETEDDEEKDHDELEFTGLVESISPDVWIVDGITLTITLQTEIEGQIEVGDFVKVEADSGQEGVLIAIEIKHHEEKEGVDEDMDDDEVEFTGFVEMITDDVWTIAGIEVNITPDTEIEDTIEVGDLVKVEAERDSDGALTATEIELVDDDDLDDQDDDGNSEHEDEDHEEGDDDDDDHDDEDEDDEDDYEHEENNDDD